MPVKEEIVIKDACILIDLADLNLFEDFFRLDVMAFTTPQVINEILDESQLSIVTSYIDNGKLRIDEYGSFGTILAIYEECKGLSFADSSVLELAIRKNAILISSDKSLRNESQRRGLKVRGVLWIIEELAYCKIITIHQALEYLRLYPIVNKRAPMSEIESAKLTV